MRLPVFLSSTVLIATAILGTSNSVYGQCHGGWCPIPNAYFDQNAPSKYGYNQNQNSQGNQNPNWQGNQSPDRRNDYGWRNGNNQSQNNNNQSSYNSRSNSRYSNQSIAEQNTHYRANNGQGYYYLNLSDNQIADENSDRLLQNKIEDALKNNYLKKNFTTVNTRVYNGNITLTGSVDSEQDRQDVEKRIRAIKGVGSINDQMQVGSSTETSYNDSDNSTADANDSGTDGSAMSASDQDLKKQADDTLKNNYVKKNYDTIVVTVSNGMVTISGMVDTDKDRQEIRDRLQKIKGIRNINDRLSVSKDKTSYNYYKKSANTR